MPSKAKSTGQHARDSEVEDYVHANVRGNLLQNLFLTRSYTHKYVQLKYVVYD
jgi:hypothetical protein